MAASPAAKRLGKGSPARRGRPSAARVGQIDAAIRSAAIELFAEAGFEATSMDAVATAAQVSKGTLYARYASKEALFRAALEHELERWSRRSALERPAPTNGLEAQLRAHARTIVAVHNWPEARRMANLLDTCSRTFPDLARDWDELVAKQSIRSLAHDMQVAGGPGVDWPFYATLFHSAVAGWYSAQARRGQPADDAVLAFADRVIDVILAALRSPGTASSG